DRLFQPLTHPSVSLIYPVSRLVAKTSEQPCEGWSNRLGRPRLDPEQGCEAERSEGHQQADARHARLAIGKGVSVDSLDEIIAGGGNQDGFRSQLQSSAGAGGLELGAEGIR